MPHRLKVLQPNPPTVKEFIAQLANAEAKQIRLLKQELAKKKSK